MKRCSLCKKEKPLDQFCKNRQMASGYNSHCKDCRNLTKREQRRAKRGYYGSEKYKLAAKRSAWRRSQKRKRKIMEHYSPDCVCQRCGFSDMRALSMDHINGDGAEHRRQIKQKLYAWIIANNYPAGFQVLCFNCQMIKRVENAEYGRCLRKSVESKLPAADVDKA